MADERRDLLEKLEAERAEADRLYDRAIRELDITLGDHPDAAPSGAAGLTDKQRLAALNQAWDIQPGGSLVGRVRNLVWRLIAPAFGRQRAFNSALVDYLNHAADTDREGRAALLRYLQTVAPYVDTKDRAIANALGSRTPVVEAALEGLTVDWLKRWESLTAREARYDARTAALTEAYTELREVVAIAQQSSLTLKRELERLRAEAPASPERAQRVERAGPERAERVEGVAPAFAPGASAGQARTPSAPTDLQSSLYVGFEDRFRGTQEDIRARLVDYMPLFAGATDVLDVGCGRGELLDLFRQNGVGARGIDTNDEMVEACRARGLQAERADAVGYLNGQPDASLDGLIAIQVVEHLEPGYLMRLIEAAAHKLRPGGLLVLETINPGCWVAFFESYIRDLTHVRPLHPDTLRYLVQTSGFSHVDIQFRAPVAEADRLQGVRLPAPPPGQEHDATLVDLVDAVNAHADKLNARLFTFMDYAVIARR